MSGGRVHGGTGAGMFDFSASISPLGLPASAREAAAASLSDAARYPDRDCRALREAIGGRYHLDPSAVLCGNGASDLLERAIRCIRPRSVCIPVPAYGEYAYVCRREGAGIRPLPLDPERDFAVGEEILERIGGDTDMVILAEPNNPTGRTTENGLLQRLLERCRERGVWLLADECFGDFLEDEGHSLLPMTDGEDGYERLIVLRAFTKFYGMAGLRLGWCACGNRELLEAMGDCGQPWAVSAPAQAAGIAALSDEAYAGELRGLVKRERAYLASSLRALGIRVVEGTANFLLFRDRTQGLHERLRREGILLRDCASFGLEEGWYRTAVLDHPENARLVAALERNHRCV